jgi:hypothetical protein
VVSGYGYPYVGQVVLWNPVLPNLIGLALLLVALPWLACRNFRCLHEARRIWRRNVLGLLAVVVFAMAASLLLYHRAWDKLTPFEPAHGPAYWTQNQKPVALRTDLNNNLLLSLPDGRFWFGCLAEPQPVWERQGVLYEYLTVSPAPRLVVHRFLEDADWISLSVGYQDYWVQPKAGSKSNQRRPSIFRHVVTSRETVGVQADGTLWVSEKPDRSALNTNALVQFGAENNWREVMGERMLSSVLLLKKDGTLWRWGDPFYRPSKVHPVWPGLRAYQPRQISTNSDWQELVHLAGPAAQKMDGSVWNVSLDPETRQDFIALNTNLVQSGFTRQPLDDSKLAGNFDDVQAGVRQDGTLWFWGHLHWDPRYAKLKEETLQSGRDTNWVAVALGQSRMVALKSDGTLWNWGGGDYSGQYADEYTRPPRPLGIHHDWVALAQTREGIVSLAADGSLWLWRDNVYYGSRYKLIPPSQKPIALGNLLSVSKM